MMPKRIQRRKIVPKKETKNKSFDIRSKSHFEVLKDLYPMNVRKR